MTTEDERKVFVGGLPAMLDEEGFRNHFSQFGNIVMCNIKKDVYTGRSRGFGFLVFENVEDMNAMLNFTPHEIGDKVVEAKKATPQTTDATTSKKLFLGGIELDVTKEDIEAAFSSRGNVVEVVLPVDNTTSEVRGFAFVTFDDSDLVTTLCSEGSITIKGKECTIKRAKNKADSRRGGMRGGRGDWNFGRGGGRGGGGYGNGWSAYNQYGGGGNYSAGFNSPGYNQYAGYNASSGGYQGSYQGGYGGYGPGSFGGYGGYGGYDQSSG